MHSHTYAGNPIGLLSVAFSCFEHHERRKYFRKCHGKVQNTSMRFKRSFANHKTLVKSDISALLTPWNLLPIKKNKIGFDSNLRIGYEIYKKLLTHGLLLRPILVTRFTNPPLNIKLTKT